MAERKLCCVLINSDGLDFKAVAHFHILMFYCCLIECDQTDTINKKLQLM